MPVARAPISPARLTTTDRFTIESPPRAAVCRSAAICPRPQDIQVCRQLPPSGLLAGAMYRCRVRLRLIFWQCNAFAIPAFLLALTAGIRSSAATACRHHVFRQAIVVRGCAFAPVAAPVMHHVADQPSGCPPPVLPPRAPNGCPVSAQISPNRCASRAASPGSDPPGVLTLLRARAKSLCGTSAPRPRTYGDKCSQSALIARWWLRPAPTGQASQLAEHAPPAPGCHRDGRPGLAIGRRSAPRPASSTNQCGCRCLGQP